MASDDDNLDTWRSRWLAYETLSRGMSTGTKLFPASRTSTRGRRAYGWAVQQEYTLGDIKLSW